MRDHLREKEEMEATLKRERQDLEMAKSESAKLAASKKDVEARLDQVASSYKAHKEEVEPLESKVSNLVRRLASADTIRRITWPPSGPRPWGRGPCLGAGRCAQGLGWYWAGVVGDPNTHKFGSGTVNASVDIFPARS